MAEDGGSWRSTHSPVSKSRSSSFTFVQSREKLLPSRPHNVTPGISSYHQIGRHGVLSKPQHCCSLGQSSSCGQSPSACSVPMFQHPCLVQEPLTSTGRTHLCSDSSTSGSWASTMCNTSWTLVSSHAMTAGSFHRE